MEIAFYDSLLPIGGEVFRSAVSDDYFQNDKLIPLSELSIAKDLNVKGKIFSVKNLNEIDFVDIIVLSHDKDLSEKIDIFKKKCKYIIEILSSEIGTELFIFGLSNMKNIVNKKHFWIPHSFTIAISNICKEINTITSIQSIFASGYNSASNEKFEDINNLYNETRGFFEASVLGKKEDMNEKERLAFNCIPKIGEIIANNSTNVEDKIEKECKFFFQENNIQVEKSFEITINLNKVPVFRGDSYFVKIEFDKPILPEDIQELFENSQKIIFSTNDFLTQAEVPQNINIFVSRAKYGYKYISFYITIDNIKICIDNAIKLLKAVRFL